jgi:hypothetical protein
MFEVMFVLVDGFVSSLSGRLQNSNVTMTRAADPFGYI